MPGRGIAMSMGRRWSRSRGISMGVGLRVTLRGGLRGGRGLGGGRAMGRVYRGKIEQGGLIEDM